jgi:hypothetical protein
LGDVELLIGGILCLPQDAVNAVKNGGPGGT